MHADFIDTEEGLRDFAEALAATPRFALDLEAAGFHRYSDRACLIQVSGGDRTWVVDPLAVDPTSALRGPLEDAGRPVVVHGGDYDVRLLNRDFGLAPQGLFDTRIAATLCGEPQVGLQALLERHLGVEIPKKYQRADWARRPLPDDMVAYAANDTRYLADLADILRDRLVELGRLAWAEEEFRALEQVRWDEEEQVDPVTRVKGARDLTRRQVHALREALAWRDEIARQRDRAPFRVAGDPVLVEAVTREIDDVGALAALKGMSPALAERHGRDLIERLRRVRALPDGDLVGYPRPTTRGPGRPTPEVEERLDRLKAVRNAHAQALGIDRGALLSNGHLLAMAWDPPADLEELAALGRLRNWQLDVLGADLIEALHRSTS
ncbi:MAG: ribonuclease D [Gemmatimonadetes bacterium]|nr:MAG: ribonuclease D [Gemmatimonadota bacterium]